MGSKRVLRARERNKPVMRIFKDFEFNEDGHTIEPISLGMVSEDGRELYLEFAFDEDKVRETNPWVHENVVPLLQWPKRKRIDFAEARIQIYAFIGTDPKPEFWAYYGDYDWVAFCRLYGKMIDLPSNFPRMCMDLQQYFKHLGSPQEARPPKPEDEHNALVDAKWNLAFWRNLEAVRAAQAVNPAISMIDATIDGMLERPGMYAGGSLLVFEMLMIHNLCLRSQILGTDSDWRKHQAKILIETTSKSAGACGPSTRLREVYGEDAFEDRNHPQHDHVIDFYRELAKRVREQDAREVAGT